jgi:hypothetical protein
VSAMSRSRSRTFAGENFLPSISPWQAMVEAAEIVSMPMALQILFAWSTVSMELFPMRALKWDMVSNSGIGAPVESSFLHRIWQPEHPVFFIP